MDNVTHALAGLLLAETVHAARRNTPAPKFARLAAIVGVVAAELPDADLVYSGRASGGGALGYLLHHRGHTHTIVAALVGALVVWGVARALGRNSSGDVRDRWWLLALCVAGTLSHLALDWTNNYGVHPFWPWNDRWYYGDAVFIVEPWLWVVSIPVLCRAARAPFARIAYAFLLAVILVAAWLVGRVSHSAALALTLGTIASVGLAFVPAARVRIATALLAWLAVELTFASASHRTHDRIVRALGRPPLDLSLTPAVSDPTCWTALAVVDDGARVRVMHGASGCGEPSVVWDQEWSVERATLIQSARDNCVISAALRFMRVPIVERLPNAIRVWDARFGRSGFASIEAPERPTSCPPNVTPWVPPSVRWAGR